MLRTQNLLSPRVRQGDPSWREHVPSAVGGHHRAHRRRSGQAHHAGKDPGGIIVTMLLGIAGALLAGWLGKVIGWYKEGQSAGFFASLIGALILLFIYRLFKGKAATTTT
jgi:uncharacterized membrane protein YeaQ/YmgE (transglycosylase-associated protein family)